jgi:hypothetical protein
MAAAAGATSVHLLHDGDPEAQGLWARYNDYPQTHELAPDELVARLSCLPGELAAALVPDVRETTGTAPALS